MELAERGIIYIDEIDKIARSRRTLHHRDVSKQGVQQALLKIVEARSPTFPRRAGASILSGFIQVDTTNILFITAARSGGLDESVSGAPCTGRGLQLRSRAEATTTSASCLKNRANAIC